MPTRTLKTSFLEKKHQNLETRLFQQISNKCIHGQERNLAKDLFFSENTFIIQSFSRQNFELRMRFSIIQAEMSEDLPFCFLGFGDHIISKTYLPIFAQQQLILIKNIRFAPENKLHQISIKNIKPGITESYI